jgi:hypothetical protein
MMGISYAQAVSQYEVKLRERGDYEAADMMSQIRERVIDRLDERGAS